MPDDSGGQKISNIPRNWIVEVSERDVQSCHQLKKNKSRIIVKLSNWKDSQQILRKKKQLCDIDRIVLGLKVTKFL